METPQQDRLHAASVICQRNMIGGFVAYCAFIPLPLVLFGYYAWAVSALGLFGLFLLLSPLAFAPSRQDVDETMRDGRSQISTQAVYVNGQYAGQRLNTDPAGQNAMDGLYGELTHGGDDGNVLTADAQLHGMANDMHRH